MDGSRRRPSRSPRDTPRLARLWAFAPEWPVLRDGLDGAETHGINGAPFVTGTLQTRQVPLVLSSRARRW